MSKTHWKKLYNPNYFGTYCFEDDTDIILTIKSIAQENVVGEGGRSELCNVMHFMENVKPLICNKTNCKTIEKLFKTPIIEEWCGRKIQLYADHNVRFGKEIVEGVRIRPFLPKIDSQEVKCSDCGNNIQPANGMNAQQLAGYTQKKYGAPLCAECATLRAQAIQDAGVL